MRDDANKDPGFIRQPEQIYIALWAIGRPELVIPTLSRRESWYSMGHEDYIFPA